MAKINFNLSKLIKNIDIEQELSNYGIQGGMSGHNLMVKCPFHSDSNPSFGIAVSGSSKGLYRCFSQDCDQRGTYFHLIAHLKKISLEEVLKKYDVKIDTKFLKELKGYLRKGLLKSRERFKIKVLKESVLNRFEAPYGPYLAYLKGSKRKLTTKTIKNFNLLCCSKGIWKDRVIIPIRDERGKLISLTARHISTDEKGKKVRKLKDTDVKQILFGLDKVKDSPKKYLVEGEFDAIYLQQYGIPAVSLGSMSTLHKLQIKRLISCTEEIGLCLDGSVDNKEVIKKTAALRKYIKTEIVKLPGGRDPNELSKEQVKKYFGGNNYE